MTAILIVLTVVCASGWFRYWLGSTVLVLFIVGKENCSSHASYKRG